MTLYPLAAFLSLAISASERIPPDRFDVLIPDIRQYLDTDSASHEFPRWVILEGESLYEDQSDLVACICLQADWCLLYRNDSALALDLYLSTITSPSLLSYSTAMMSTSLGLEYDASSSEDTC